jgi:eukaryotic-like serine/threonine-protein kinase
MRCARCQADNPESSRYCGRCSAPLGAPERWPADPDRLEPGRVLAGKYEVAEELGRGGMGVVYRARDLRLKRWVALKFLPPHLADSDELRERFLIEAQAAAALSHPNICVIHEVAEADGRPFIAMEVVEGETLGRRIEKGPLAIDDALSLITQVLAGLDEAHRKGIIHRDIKSGNIMVTEAGHARIMDFGLARLQGSPSLTKTGATLGTVAYMSPEQARGEEVDHRTDLWSAGVVLYEMLTGELPFQGGHEAVVVHALIHEDPRPMAPRAPPVPPELRQVVARALKKDPGARYASAADMLRDLRDWDEGRRGAGAGLSGLRPIARRLRRPAVAIPAGVAALALVAVAAWGGQRRADVRWARDVALPEIERLIEENDVWRNLVAPYRLAERAERHIPGDPRLAALFARMSLEVDVRTDPPGAGVWVKEYEDPDADWSYLGVSPLEQVRVPIGIFRWKLEKEGYETVLAASSTWDIGADADQHVAVVPYHLARTLDPVGSVPPGMVRVQGAETPVGPVADFFIDRFEVTNQAYRAFIDAGGYTDPAYWTHPFVDDGVELSRDEAMRRFVDATGRPGPSTWQAGTYPDGQADHPVSGVSWYEAAAYAGFVGKSLPTSLHWGLARGETVPMIQWRQLGGFALLAPFSNFGGSGPVPVGSLDGITPWGAVDMAGNVREWCWNQTQQGRVVRGGAWDDNTYEFGRRGQAPAMDRSARNGFRLALYPDPAAAPPAAFQPQRLAEPTDVRLLPPVPDPIFQVYREQFAYDDADLRPRVESRRERPGDWVHETVSFDAAYGGERVLAHLFLPVNARPPFQTVLYFPGSGATWVPTSQNMESYYEFTMFLAFLVKNGRAVIFPVYKGTFERGDPALSAIHVGAPSHGYSELVVQVVKDLRRSIDYLETRPDIDSRKLAFYGMSWGGALGAIIPAVEDRFATSVLLAGGVLDQARPEVHPINYVGRVTTATLMLNGRYDTALDAGIRPMFDLLGTPPEHKRLVLYDSDHIPPRNEFVRETLAWLDRYLGPVER